MDLISALEYPNFQFSRFGSENILEIATKDDLSVAGQYSVVCKKQGEVIIARDPLGCNKLFYGYNETGALIVANRIERALKLGVNLDNLASCPPGYAVRISENGTSTLQGSDISSRKPADAFDLDTFQRQSTDTLCRAMIWLKSSFPDHYFAVCLSGGMDSSVIASLAAKFLENVLAVSFSYLSEGDVQDWLAGTPVEKLKSVSEDFLSACEVAKALSIPFFPVFRPGEAVLSMAPNAVRLCQDWRDFNVHCAVVNLFLAQDLRALFPHGQVVVLTGDLMNEFVCDYHEEVIDGTVYYPQPRMSLENRRRFFVRGLDAGDREIGVFNAFGLPVCQIFSTVADLYLQVPGDLLSRSDVKEILNGHLLDSSLSDKVSKVKRRAQVGGSDGGTLGIFHRKGLTQQRLQELWIQSLPERMRGNEPLDIIQFGRYRATRRGEG